MTDDNTTTDDDEYGPATIDCPYCGDEQVIDAGPTRLTYIQHGECPWILIDLEDELAGKADPREEPPYEPPTENELETAGTGWEMADD